MLLRDRQRSVTAVAAESGFFDAGRFAGEFARQFGMTPRALRRHAS